MSVEEDESMDNVVNDPINDNELERENYLEDKVEKEVENQVEIENENENENQVEIENEIENENENEIEMKEISTSPSKSPITKSTINEEDSGGVGSRKSDVSIVSVNSTLDSSYASSVFPLSRIKKIMKEDEDVKNISNDSLFLVAKAAELFISHFAAKSYTWARYDKRKTLAYKDLAKQVRESESMQFLSDLVPELIAKGKATTSRREIMKELAFENITTE